MACGKGREGRWQVGVEERGIGRGEGYAEGLQAV